MKYLKIFFMIFTLTFLLNVDNVYAYTLPNFDDIVTNDDGSQKYYFITGINTHSDDDSEKSYRLVVSQKNNAPVIITGYAYDIYRQDSEFTGRTFSQYECKIGDDIWTHVKTGGGFVSIGIPESEYTDTMEYDEIILYSNYDLTYAGKTVFQSPRTLAKAFQVIPMTVRTGILSQLVYLIPCLISLVIGLIAFRKAWSWLKIQLQV